MVIVSNMVDQGRIILQNFGLCNLSICSNYHNTTEVAYCVPYLHNMLPLSYYHQVCVLCTLPTQYAPNITKLLR